jgi:hypothetical protein
MNADFISMLSFTGMRSATIEAVTVPPLTTPKGKTADNRYPWDNGQGFNTSNVGIVKRATVRGIVGADWDALVTAERLKEGITDANGDATYNGTEATNKTVWMADANGNRLAFKRNAKGDRFYCPLVITASLGYDYYTLDGVELDKATVAPYLRDRSNEGRRQGVSDPLVYRGYALDNLASLKIGERISEGQAKDLYDALKAGDYDKANRLFTAYPLTA